MPPTDDGPDDGLPEGPPEAPPADPEDWTDEQWLAWLRATDGEAAGQDGTRDDGPATGMGRLATSGSGQVLGNAMLGMADAIYGREHREIAVVTGDAQPGDDEPFTVQLDPDHPEQARVVFRRGGRSGRPDA